MNDLFIITVCIFLLILTWSIYFKKFLKEGYDPAQANYTMPISFSGEGNSKTINIPPKVTTNGTRLTLDPDTTIVGETKLNKSLILNPISQITFGDGTAISTNNKWGRDNRNELEIVGVGNCDRGCNRFIHMWDDVQVERDLKVYNNLKVYNDVNSNSINTGSSNVAGNSTTKSLGVADSTATGSLVVGGNTKTGSLNVNDNTTTGSLNVNNNTTTGSLNVNNNTTTGSLNTNSINVNDSIPIKGMQAGRSWVNTNDIWNWTRFPKAFKDNNVIVVISHYDNNNGPAPYQWNTIVTVKYANADGFRVVATGISQGGTWGGPVIVNWIAMTA